MISNRHVEQIALVVPHVERAAQLLADVLEVPVPPLRAPEFAESQRRRRLTYLGEPLQGSTRIAFFYMENVDIELIEPVGGPNVWSEFLPRNGGVAGGHHLAFVESDATTVLADLAQKGYPTPQTGVRGIGAPYGYADATGLLGAYIEVLGDPATAAGIEGFTPLKGAEGLRAERDTERVRQRAYALGALGTRRVAQAGFVVPDVERASRELASLLGMDAPAIQSNEGGPPYEVRYRGRPSQGRLRWAMLEMENLTIELAQPVDAETTWQETLDAHGPSMHHIAFEVPDFERARKHLAALEFQEVQVGRWSGGAYANYDLGPDFGVQIELLDHSMISAPSPLEGEGGGGGSR